MLFWRFWILKIKPFYLDFNLMTRVLYFAAMSTPNTLTYVCSPCGNAYRSIQGLRQHQRRYCKGPQTTVNTCPTCQRSFSSFAGLRQHIRLAHPVIYNAEMEQESAGRRLLWSKEEAHRLAAAEASSDFTTVTELLQHLQPLSNNRSIDAIKGRRKRRSYKALVAQLKNRSIAEEHEESATPHVNTASLPTMQPTQSRPSSRRRLTINNCSFIKQFLFDSVQADEKDKDVILSIGSSDAEDTLCTWLDDIFDSLPIRRSGHTHGSNSKTRMLKKEEWCLLSNRSKRKYAYKQIQALWQTDSCRCVTNILNDEPLYIEDSDITSVEMENRYANMFETYSQTLNG